MAQFTSIFHEEVITVNEFKGEAEASYAARRNAEKMSHAAGHKKLDPDKVNHQRETKTAEKLRDKGEGKPARLKDEMERRKAYAQADKNTYDRDNTRRENMRNIKKDPFRYSFGNSSSRRRAANESVLPEIELI